MRLFLVRHGQTILNALGRTQGWVDAPLTAEGESTARSVGRGLAAAGVRFDTAYAADMMRHGQTAQLILDTMRAGIPLRRTMALRETAFGGYEAVEAEEMWAGAGAMLGDGPERPLDRHGIDEYLDALRDSNPVPELPAEGFAEATARIMPGIEGIVAAGSAEDDVLAVTSGLTMMCVLTALRLGPIPRFVPNGAVTILEHTGAAWGALSINDTRYADAEAA